MNMRIQICGAGIAGSYLYFLLSNEPDLRDVRVFEKRSNPDCRCGWGTVYSEAKELYEAISLNFDDYVLVRPKEVVANGIGFRNKDLVTFDRKRLLQDLWEDIEFGKDFDNADLIIDATGAARAYLPKVNNDRVGVAYQSMEVHRGIDENFYIHVEKTGYAWAFPLGNNLWHIGAGEMEKEKVPELIDGLRKRYGFEGNEVVCSCWSRLRMKRMSECKPFIHGKIVGVGEAIGTVSGAGEGNIPSLVSARVLHRCIAENRLEDYEREVMKELEWVENEQKFVDALLNRKVFSVITLLPKIIAHERKRTVDHSITDIKKLLDLR